MGWNFWFDFNKVLKLGVSGCLTLSPRPRTPGPPQNKFRFGAALET